MISGISPDSLDLKEEETKMITEIISFNKQEYAIIQKIRKEKAMRKKIHELIDIHIFQQTNGKWVWICPFCYAISNRTSTRKKTFEKGRTHMQLIHKDSTLLFYVLNIEKISKVNALEIQDYYMKRENKYSKFDKWLWACPECEATAVRLADYSTIKSRAKQHAKRHQKRLILLQKINVSIGAKVSQENCKKCVFGGCRGAKCKNQNAHVIFQIDGWYCQSMKEKTELQPLQPEILVA